MNLKPINIDTTEVIEFNEEKKLAKKSSILYFDNSELENQAKNSKLSNNTLIIQSCNSLNPHIPETKEFSNTSEEKTDVKQSKNTEVKKGKLSLLISEKKLRTFVMISTSFFIFLLVLLLILFFTNAIPISNLGFYVIPSIVILFLLYNFFISLIEFKGLNKLTKTLTIEGDLNSNSLITDFYIKMQKKHISTIWFAIFYTFYVGIFTLIFWGIQSQNWLNGALNFQLWISNAFPTPFNPFWATILFGSSILLVILITLIFSLIRRFQSINFLAYFDQEVIKIEVIESIRKNRNKFYLKIFIFSILIVFVIPIIFYFVVKGIRK
ncbi:MSC_0882 family membrane protein [[Mycoplasma] mobile]|uniref:MSC_0882 family membrane protein n=1 Tax=[Mycoplasma] mobile TaxID=2118 RepID=UPI0002F6B7BC|nr:hypothetical protein [[Mycoplasma] mobile]